MKKIMVLDTGKEWGGGTNSLLELLRRIDRNKYSFSSLFYKNYKWGDGSNIRTEIKGHISSFYLQEQKKEAISVKILKEILRLFFFFSSDIKRYLTFKTDYHFKIRENAVKIAKLLKQGEFDLLYLNNQPSSNLEGILAAEMAGVPVIQHCRKVATLNTFEVKAANRVLARIICVSAGVKEEYIKQGVDPSKCLVIYNGIDLQTEAMTSAPCIRKKWGISEDEILIGTAGSLLKGKRIDDLLDIFIGVRDASRKKIKCMIVGDGPEKNHLHNIAEKKGLTKDIVFTGFQKDAVSLINAMDIFIMTSEKEGLPRVILEAMLIGKPVVASDVTGNNELVVDGETGRLISPGHTEEFVPAILKLIEDNESRSLMGEKARNRVIDNFSMERYVSGVENALDGLFNK